VGTTRERAEFFHITRGDETVVLAGVREDIVFVIRSCPSVSRTCSALSSSLSRYVTTFGSIFCSRRNRHATMSGGVQSDAVRTFDRFPKRFHRIFSFGFSVAHLTRMVVVVRERVVDVCHI